MVFTRSKSALFEEHRIPTEGTDTLYAKALFPKPPMHPKRLVLMPPLIGGSASTDLIVFRILARRGAIVLSYEYRGHPRSTGRFDLDGTVVDTRYAIRWAEDYARRRGLPLHAVTSCYGVVSLCAQFKPGLRRPPFWSFNTVSGLFRMDQIIQFSDFAPIFFRHVGVELDRALHSPEGSNQVAWNGDPFRAAMHEFLGGLFPKLRVGHDHFEELQYDRADMRKMLLQLLHATYLDSICIPPELPCNVVYGRDDDVMGLHTPAGREEYRKRVLALIPHAEFHEMDVDHFARGSEQAATFSRVADCMEDAEARAVNLTDANDQPTRFADECAGSFLER
jgi:hypothetical protein